MRLADQLTSYIAAAFTGVWIETREADEAEREIMQLARKNQWKLAVLEVANGLRVPGATSANTDSSGGDPLAALRALLWRRAPSDVPRTASTARGALTPADYRHGTRPIPWKFANARYAAGENAVYLE